MGIARANAAGNVVGRGRPLAERLQGPASLIAAALIVLAAIRAQTADMAMPEDAGERSAAQRTAAAAPSEPTRGAREILLSGYISQPFYYRSDLHLVRPNGTDLKLKRLGWDGDALMPPIDGGIRSMEWWGSFGVMVDFLHNKAVARLGRGAHGRRIANPVIDEVEIEGALKGQAVKRTVKLTEIFTRLEFTHGHNVLMLTPMVSLVSFLPGVRPYVGIGAGVAIPHVEVWYPGEAERTNEYQYGGPAAQVLAGIEIRRGKGSVFIEYKFSYAWIRGTLTGEQSWMNFNMPGDLLRQFRRWWRGEAAPNGHFSTTLGAHQIAVGAGYWWQGRAVAGK